VRDRFLCPAEFLNFRLSGELSSEAGYFTFGRDTVCYGRFRGKDHSNEPNTRPYNAFSGVSWGGAGLELPFDPTEVIDNARLERYPGCRLDKFERIAKRTYYRLRPFTSFWMRRSAQRFRAHAGRKKAFPRWPVDTTVEDICENLLLLALRAGGVRRVPFVWFWPDGARGCVTMTHDVETEAGRDFSLELLGIDESFGIKSSFQLVPEERYTVAQTYLRALRDRGFEICVQDINHDGRLFDERELFLRRVCRINRYGREFGAKGFRSAVLYRKPEWFGDLDFSFDMSIPNVAHFDPQKGGCCTVMPYFIGDLVELPLTTIQDYTLFHVLGERSIELWKRQMDLILAKHGMTAFLIHPDYIRGPRTLRIYKELLALLGEIRRREAIWFALPCEVDKWWRARSRMSVIREGKSWRIVGDGSERAVLAFATEVDGQLAYELADRPQPELRVCRTKAAIGPSNGAHQIL
jgi:hypothetical protein